MRNARALLLCLLLASCGGGGGGGGGGNEATTPVLVETPLPPLGAGESAYDDPATYSSAGTASLPGATEGAAVTRSSITLNGQAIAYTARTGHLIAREPTSGAAQASVFYVAYTADGADTADPRKRPVTFFYNGGPGSASVWLHLGSFGPVRLATGVPATTIARPFALVANSESLLDTTDLVFINAVGTGLSQAIEPYTNSSFWGVDADAALFRDFITRWLAVNNRAASPKFLFGESYGGPRTAVLARLLQSAGVMLDGLVLQSPALDYNSNCGVIGRGNCQGYLPSYAATGVWHRLVAAAPADLASYLGEIRSYAGNSYGPAVDTVLGGGTPPVGMTAQLAKYTGLSADIWNSNFNLAPDTLRSNLVRGSLLGRYDARMIAAQGSELASEGDPSSTWITSSFSGAITTHLRTVLRYNTGSTYVVSGSAIQSWNFSHAGRSLPDTVPDLAAALAQNAALRVLAVNGYHDLATPFRVTELDLQRLNSPSRVQVRNYAGGHMSYLDDGTRVLQKADLKAFYGQQLAAHAASLDGVSRILAARKTLDRVALGADHAGKPATQRQPSIPEPPVQAPLRDPWVPGVAPLLLGR